MCEDRPDGRFQIEIVGEIVRHSDLPTDYTKPLLQPRTELLAIVHFNFFE